MLVFPEPGGKDGGRAGDVTGATEPFAGTVLIARGSSDHAATTGRYLLELATRRPVASASPSLYTMYGAQTDFTGFLVVAASQSVTSDSARR